ncbi:Metallo-dependent phosphatase [Aspergillus floccosus]
MAGTNISRSSSWHFRVSHEFALSWLRTIVWGGHIFLKNLVTYFVSMNRGRQQRRIRVVCLSDTHSQRCDVPDGDLLIHAGDLSINGSAAEIQETIDWLGSLPHKHKVVIAGNSDLFFDVRSRLPEDRSEMVTSSDKTGERDLPDKSEPGMLFDWGNVHYLHGTSVTLSFDNGSSNVPRQLNIYGAPLVPKCGPDSENAFQYPVGHNPWEGNIPQGTDILVTHTPPKYHLDWYYGTPEGCPWLLQELWKVRPLLHVFGHVHTSYGTERVFWNDTEVRWENFCSDLLGLSSQDQHTALMDNLQPRLWVGAVTVILSGVRSLLGTLFSTSRAGAHSTLMVNAACMSEGGQRLEKKPHLIYI